MRQLPCLKSFPVLKLRLRYQWSESRRAEGWCRHLESATLPAQLSSLQLVCPRLGTVAAHFPQAWEIPGCPQWEVALDFVEAPIHQ